MSGREARDPEVYIQVDGIMEMARMARRYRIRMVDNRSCLRVVWHNVRLGGRLLRSKNECEALRTAPYDEDIHLIRNPISLKLV